MSINELPLETRSMTDYMSEYYNTPKIVDLCGMKNTPHTTGLFKLSDGTLATVGRQLASGLHTSLGVGVGIVLTQSLQAVALPDKEWVWYTMFSRQGFALSADGELYSWGSNNATLLVTPAPNYSIPYLVKTGVRKVHISQRVGHNGISNKIVLEMLDNTFLINGNSFRGILDKDPGAVNGFIDLPIPTGEDINNLKEFHQYGGPIPLLMWTTKQNKTYFCGDNTYGQYGLGHSDKLFGWQHIPWLDGKEITDVIYGDIGHDGVKTLYTNPLLSILSGTDLYITGQDRDGITPRSGRHDVPYVYNGVDSFGRIGTGVNTQYMVMGDKFVVSGYWQQGGSGGVNSNNKLVDISPEDLTGKKCKIYVSNGNHYMDFSGPSFLLVEDSDGQRLYSIGSNASGIGASGIGVASTGGKMNKVYIPKGRVIKDIVIFGPNGAKQVAYFLMTNGELWGCGWGGDGLLFGMSSSIQLTAYASMMTRIQ